MERKNLGVSLGGVLCSLNFSFMFCSLPTTSFGRPSGLFLLSHQRTQCPLIASIPLQLCNINDNIPLSGNAKAPVHICLLNSTPGSTLGMLIGSFVKLPTDLVQ